MKDRLPRRWRRISVAVAGWSVIVLGIIAIPAPGPGWLIIFAGLGILSKEFPWAERALRYGQSKYSVWEEWLRNQNSFIRLVISVCFVASLLLVLWFGNLPYIVTDFIGFKQEWLQSPLFK